MTVTYHVGDTRDVIATIPDNSVSLVACSPPFIALRSYLPADHPDKHREIGSEPDPATFIDTLLALTADWGRVLAPWGSIAIELGDTFAGDDRRNGETVDVKTPHRSEVGRAGSTRANVGRGWPRAKCLALVPQAYAMSLAYGRNVLNGNPSPAGQWLVRNQIVWHRPNPAVGALGDKYRPCTSYITVATRSPKRWFDLTAVRNTASDVSRLAGGMPSHDTGPRALNPAGAPPLDCWFDEWDGHDTWTVTTQPSSLAHYAMWPAKLAERLILSMCPAEVCTLCGEPRRRIEGRTPAIAAMRAEVGDFKTSTAASGLNGTQQTHERHDARLMDAAQVTTLGWTECGCGVPYMPGTVLDPFAGTGTTGAVADLHGRNAVLIDIDTRNPLLYDARRAECARNLFGSPAINPAQLDLFGTAP